MHKVPIEHAAWVGSYLAQLSDDQLRTSFRAADYDRPKTEAYVRALRHRINELNGLRDDELAERQRRRR